MRSYPELRQDLIVREHTAGGAAVFVVKDPVANKFFRFVVFQYYVATLLDGRTPLEAVRETVSRRMGRAVSLKSIEAFVARLETCGLLETSTAREHVRPRSLLYYTRPLVNPERGIGWLYRRLSWCFTPAFAVCSAGWMVLAAWAVLTDREGFLEGVAGMMPPQPSTLLYIYLLNALVITIHECAHALACRHFGGTVKDMGFLLIYFQPAFYTDVSDSYLFERKRDRMIVMLAGMYSGLLIAASAAIVWRVAEPFTGLYEGSLLVFMAACWGLFFNLNPLIKLDGYFMLNDWLDMPNLRRRAFTYVKRLLLSLVGFPETALRRLRARERGICLAYGLSASVYSLALLGLFAVFIGEIALAYLPECMLIALMFGLASTMHRTPSALHAEEKAPEGLPQPVKRRRIPGRAVASGVLLAGTVLGLVFVKIDLRISAPFRLRPVDQAAVRAEVAGQIETVYVDEGDTVRAGQPLARLFTRDLEAELRGVQAQIAQAEAEVRLLERGARPEELEQAGAALEEARTNLEAAQAYHERTVKLAGQQMVSQQDLEAARTDLRVKQAIVEQAVSRLALLRAGARKEEIDARRARIQELEARAGYIAGQIRRCEIVSPIPGVVTTPFLRERRGAFVEVGETVCELVDYRRMLVDMAVPEREMEDVRSGYPVRLKVQGFPALEFEGEVTAIAPVAIDEEGRSTVHVKSEIDNASGLLKAGMTGLARVYCGPRPVGAILLRRIVRYMRTEFWW